MKRDIISVLDMENELDEIIDLSMKLKRNRYESYDHARNRVLGMIFEKPSTRTRVSLETAMAQLGGHAIYLNPNDMQMGRGETVADTARVLSGFVDVISYRAFSHSNVVELAQNASVPVINALDDLEHPVQIVADFMTLKEKKGRLGGLKLAYLGDGNNVANSLLLGGAITGMDVYVGCPRGYEPNKEILEKAKQRARSTGSSIVVTQDPVEAVKDADAVYTDVWASMGDESVREKKEKDLKNFQVNSEIVSHAKKDYTFLHCLPAHRGLEVTGDVIDGVNSAVFQEAENRLHTEKALIYRLLE
ncbi:ornithine carbamoyltransferase [uncultured archaeon]|nr:ornithine carbamoyltransferase [uncultured archaeon]HKJ96986.1 ornithine carbamoyltransferase [Thermoplasmataceae archaeon]